MDFIDESESGTTSMRSPSDPPHSASTSAEAESLPQHLSIKGEDSNSDDDDTKHSHAVPPALRDIIPADLVEISPSDESIFIVGTQSGKVLYYKT